MNKQTLYELLAALATPEDLPLGAVPHFLALRPQARELVERLDALEKNVGVLLAPRPAQVVAKAAEPGPVTVVVEKVQHKVAIPQPRRGQWTLHDDDIELGIIAWFDADTLNTDPHVEKAQRFDQRVSARAKSGRPFICINADEEESSWVSLSTQYNERYLKLQAEWIRSWGAMNKQSYATGHVYRGPHHSFCVAAAQVEYPDASIRRPRLTAKGLQAVVEWVEARQATNQKEAM